jgi:hypothetical protein
MDRTEFDHWDDERKRRRAERETRRAERRHERGEEEPESLSERERGARKAKVLHTRISEQLDESLRSAANELRVPVSNLVRNVLEDVFDVVETVTENVEDLVGDLLDEADDVRDRFGHRRRRHRGRTRRHRERDPKEQELDNLKAEILKGAEERPQFPDVVGWQPLVLNGDQQCSDCGRDLRRGDDAFLGLGPSEGPSIYLCKECVDARASS